MSAIVALIAAYVWMYGYVANSAFELLQSDTDIASRRKEQQQAGALKTLLREHSADFDRIRALGISRTNPVAFFKKFETLGAVTRTAIAIDLDNRETAGDMMAFRFTIEGAEENVADVLKLMESAPYQLIIDDLSIQRIEDSPKVRLRIGIRVKALP